jgi:curli biogenesis system outer membrane secretion channel CsgG
MKRLAFALCLAAVAMPALAQDAPATAAKRRVAVLDFDYNAVQSNVTGLLGAGADIGKGVVTELVSELVRNGTYTVMERAQVDRILNEQNFQQGNRSDASSAARIGKLLGVDAIIIGSITQFDRQNNKIALGFKKETKAIVVIDARIVGMKTGEILAVAEGKGEAKRSSLNTDDDKNAAFNRA